MSESKTKGQLWSGLKRAWKDYRRGKIYGNKEATLRAAKRIIEYQDALGVPHANFSELGLKERIE